MFPSSVELRYFQEIATANNFSRAANKLGISQPTLSIAIQKLEKYMGAELFIRHKKGVALTSAGKTLLLQTKVLLDHWENIKLDAESQYKEVKGEMTLGCPATVALHLGKILPNLLDHHPELTFNLHHDISPNITRKILEGEIEIGLVNNPTRHPDLIIQKIKETEYSFWKNNESRFTKDFNSNKLVIICDPNLPHAGLLLNKLKHANLNAMRLITSNHLEIVASLTAYGCGIGILPACYAHSVYSNQLKKIASAPYVKAELYLIYRKENRSVRRVRAVIEVIKQHVSEYPMG